jgi:uncharacterized protein with NAD-binding domain and iron-sulfur cluster
MTRRIAVVGGGLAGIAAALECAEAGASVTLYESRTRLGGATFSVERDGKWLDNGQHIALRCCTSYLTFLERLGVAQLAPVQRRLRVPVLREGKPAAFITRNGLPAPLHLGSSLLRYPLLTVRERLSAVRAALALRRLDPDDPTLDEQTFGDWLRAHSARRRRSSGRGCSTGTTRPTSPSRRCRSSACTATPALRRSSAPALGC